MAVSTSTPAVSATPNAPLVFNVLRKEAELVAPAGPTPYEWKELSDIDDQEGLRFQVPIIQFYNRCNRQWETGRDPVKVIKEALGKALVYYYPLAGRLREKREGRKLVVECTAEGVLFIEANADVTMADFGESLRPPFPGFHGLLYDVPGSSEVLHCPLLLVQVTCLKCGGFIVSLRLNHTMADAAGFVQFLSAVAELARGADYPSTPPVWQRDLLKARDPPRVTCLHREYDVVEGDIVPLEGMAHCSFFFGDAEIAALRRHLPPHLRSTFSTFDLITACFWRCRTIAIQSDPNDEFRLLCIVNARSRFNPPLPVGYWGNSFAFPAAVSTAGKLCANPLVYALELVRKAKAEVTEEYMKSVADLMVIRGRPNFTTVRSYIVSDNTRARFIDIDFGWGQPVYGGVAKAGVGPFPGVSFYVAAKNINGERGIVVPLYLSGPAMEIFVRELNRLLQDVPIDLISGPKSPPLI